MNHENDTDRLSKELMRRFQARDREAMGHLYELHDKTVREVIGKKLNTKNGPRLDEACQDVWLALLERASSYRETEVPFVSWLLEIVAVVYTRIQRKAYRNSVVEEHLMERALYADAPPTLEESVERDALVVDADRAFDLLLLGEREVFRLRHDEELTWAEIARMCGKSITTVRRYYDSAVKKLASVLEEYVPEGSSPQLASDDPPEAQEEEPRDAA